MISNKVSQADEVIQRTIGLRVKICREAKGISQVAFARHLKVTQSAVSRIEAGQWPITVPVLIKIASILNVSFSMLIGKLSDYE